MPAFRFLSFKILPPVESPRQGVSAFPCIRKSRGASLKYPSGPHPGILILQDWVGPKADVRCLPSGSGAGLCPGSESHSGPGNRADLPATPSLFFQHVIKGNFKKMGVSVLQGPPMGTQRGG